MDELDNKIVRQVTQGLTVAEIDKATDAQLFQELERLFLDPENYGGKIEVTCYEDPDDDPNEEPYIPQPSKRRPPEITLFTCSTQHVTGSDFRNVIKRALVEDMIHREYGPFAKARQRLAFLRKHNVPLHLRHKD